MSGPASAPPESRISAVWREGARAVGLEVEADARWHRAHQRPGQYALAGEPSVPLAIASPPGAPVQLLLGVEAAARLRPVVGAALPLGPPEGPGFALDEARGREVLVFAIGTAASAARALMEALALERSTFGRVRVYLGAHTSDDHVYVARDAPWAAAGIEVVRATSKPWVQSIFLADEPPSPGARVFAAGHAALIAGVREAMSARGLDPATLGLNVPT